MKKIVTTTVTLAVLAISISSAQAAINITEATIQNGSVSISGNQAPRNAAIWWEGKATPSTSKNSGAFHLDTTNLPVDCVGRLQIGTEQRDVVINNCTPRAAVLKTGETKCYVDNWTVIPCAGTGHDGEFQKGAVSPVPRFTDNLNGTITDNLTGLIWLKEAKCFGPPLDWQTALDRAKGLADGTCGLTDNSVAGDWRVPNRNELTSLLDSSTFGMALPPGHPFTNFEHIPYALYEDTVYWTSTKVASNLAEAWAVDFYYGSMRGGVLFSLPCVAVTDWVTVSASRRTAQRYAHLVRIER